MRRTTGSRIAAIALVGALTGGGLAVVGAPAAVADSRCTTTSHTHGHLFWQRTDNFLGKFKNPTYKRWSHQHTNSNPTNCASL